MRGMKRFALLVMFLLPAFAGAQTRLQLRDLMQARNYAMGGAYRALSFGTEAIAGNPAAMALYPRYQIELGGAWDVAGQNAVASASVLDSVSGPLAAGVTYQLVTFGQGVLRRTAHFNTLALCLPLLPNVWIGASARHLLMTGAASANAITSDAAVLMRFFDSLSLSVAAHNWIDTGHEELSPYYSLSAGWVTGMVALTADVRGDFGIPGSPLFAIGFGAEYVVGQGIPLRLGYSIDNIAQTKAVSGGIGWMSSGGSVDLAYRHDVDGGFGRLISLSFRFQLG
jgi:hypothetical protein